MVYRILRWISGIALHWFYRDIRVMNNERIPLKGPLFIAVNHQNALVDSLLIGWVTPRKVTMTAKATLLGNPFIGLLFRLVGVVPLRRASDEVAARAKGRALNRSRNEGAFRELLDTVENNGAVLIFPEGKSHNEPGLEPLRTGLARLALSARDDRSVRSVKILPIGLVFEDKGAPGSVVDVHVGNTVEMDSWAGNDPNELTDEISRRLRILSERASMPIVESYARTSRSAPLRDFLISLAAAWGRITHELPVRFARRLVVRKTRDADQPAMLTMVVATGLALLVYAISFAVVSTLVHSAWISGLFVASLLLGAYWAAFKDHRRA
jgi:1-acyl-sn-glycerol-3-phosphate acyltransferase